MIISKVDYKYYLKVGRIAKELPMRSGDLVVLKEVLFPNEILQLQKALGNYKFYKNCRKEYSCYSKMLLSRGSSKKLSVQLRLGLLFDFVKILNLD